MAVSYFSRRLSPGTSRDWTARRIMVPPGMASPARRCGVGWSVRPVSPRGVGGFSEQGCAERRDRARDPLVHGGEGVLVFDRDDVVVSGQAERGHEPLPEQQVVAIAHAAEHPGPFGVVARR